MRKPTISNLLAFALVLGFLLGVHNGRIAVWKDQDPTPMRTIPCPIWVLSPTQQQMLKDGIHIDSMEDLEKMLTEFFP